MPDDRKVLGDVIEAVVVYNKDYGSRTKEEREILEAEEVGDDEQIPPTKKASAETSSDKQLGELSSMIIKGDDKVSTRKKITKILKSGDPITESKAVMVVLARKELENALRLMDNISRLDSILMARVENGDYDDTGDFDISSVMSRMEKSLSRALTIVEKVLGKPEYEEFLLAYRDEIDEDDMKDISTIATDKDSRERLRGLLRSLKGKI